MTHYVAIVEDAGPETAVGVWFPDLPGCFSAGDTVDDALANAGEAMLAYAEALGAEGRSMPRPRTIAELRQDAVFSAEAREHMVAVVPLPELASSVA